VGVWQTVYRRSATAFSSFGVLWLWQIGPEECHSIFFFWGIVAVAPLFMKGVQMHPFYGSPAWKAARRSVLIKAGYRCSACGTPVAGKGQARVDHIVPVKQRPDLALSPANLRVLCVPCDNARHAEKGGGVTRPDTDATGFPSNSDWS